MRAAGARAAIGSIGGSLRSMARGALDRPDDGPSPDASLIKGVRWRLILWSGGSTLVLLIVLGGLLYWTTAERLRTESIAQLEVRAKSLQPIVDSTSIDGFKQRALLKVTSDATAPGMLIGGPASGTIAFIMPAASPPAGFGTAGEAAGPTVTQEGPTTGAPFDRLILSELSPSAVAAAMRGETTIEERDINGAPFRVLTLPVDVAGERFVIGVIGDRTAEINTLQTLLFVLLVGGLATLAGAVAVGSVYAGRALVPIRESLRRQREFAADASHELRTPLAIVTGATEELRRSGGDPTVAGRAVADIEAGTQRLTGLVDDLLFLARADSDAIELVRVPVDLGEVSGEALASFDGLARDRGVRLRLDVEPAPIEGDELRLRQLVGILLDNAIRHSPPDGAVTIRVRHGARLEVEDEGPGLAEADLENVFRRFWRAADAPAGGTGLGLAIADWIVRGHGGRIQAANSPAGGARFTVSLPAG